MMDEYVLGWKREVYVVLGRVDMYVEVRSIGLKIRISIFLVLSLLFFICRIWLRKLVFLSFNDL